MRAFEEDSATCTCIIGPTEFMGPWKIRGALCPVHSEYYRRRKAEDRALQRIDRQAARYRRKQDDLYGELLEKLFPRRRKINWPA